MGYDSFVRNKLLGRANVFYHEDNGRHALYTLRAMSDWKGQLSLPQIDIVHWNNGLWDALHLNSTATGSTTTMRAATSSPAKSSAFWKPKA